MSLNKYIKLKLRPKKEQRWANHQAQYDFEYVRVVFYELKNSIAADERDGSTVDELVDGIILLMYTAVCHAWYGGHVTKTIARRLNANQMTTIQIEAVMITIDKPLSQRRLVDCKNYRER